MSDLWRYQADSQEEKPKLIRWPFLGTVYYFNNSYPVSTSSKTHLTPWGTVLREEDMAIHLPHKKLVNISLSVDCVLKKVTGANTLTSYLF
jgi:hypothetical protein